MKLINYDLNININSNQISNEISFNENYFKYNINEPSKDFYNAKITVENNK